MALRPVIGAPHPQFADAGPQRSVQTPAIWPLDGDETTARPLVHPMIRDDHPYTGGAMCRLVGNQGCTKLRRAILDNRVLNDERR